MRHPTPSTLALAAWLALASCGAQAQAQAQPASLSIAAQPLGQALNQLARQAGLQLSFPATLVAGKQAPAVAGSLTPRQALDRLLAGSGLAADIEGATVTVRPVVPAHAPEDSMPSAPQAAQLPAVRVVGKTEGTGSYTTDLSNTATKLNLSLRETPQSITVMTHKRMQDQGLDEISEVLEQTTGLYFNNTNVVGSDSNYVYSRGFELQNYQVNGVPRSTRFGFKNDIADTALFDRVETVRGASGLLNGVGEPSGAVNLVRKLPTREFQAHVTGKVGSWSLRRAEADVSGPLTQDGRVRGRLVGVRQDNGSFMDRVDMDKEVLYGVLEVDLTPSTVLSAGLEYQTHRTRGASALYSGAPIFYADGTRTGFGRSTNLAADWAATLRRNQTLFAGLEHFFDNDWTLKLDLEQSSRRYDITNANARVNSVLQAGNAGIFGASMYDGKPTQYSASVHATGPYRLFGRRHELVLGASHYQMKEIGRSHRSMNVPIATGAELAEIIRTGDYPEGDLGLTGAGSTTRDRQSAAYAATRISATDGLSFILGSRLTYWQTRMDRTSTAGVTTRGETSKETAVLTPYAGVVLDLTDHVSVYGSYTDIFQPATRYDANGALLAPAEGSNLEAGVKLAFFENRLNLSAAVFRTKKDNVPEYVPDPSGAANYGPTGQYVYEGVNGTRTTGFEFDVAGQLTPNWQVAGGYSANDPRDAQGQRRLTYIPRKTFKLFTSYRPAQWLPGLTLGANLRWQNRIETLQPYPYAQGSFAVVDLMLHHDFTPQLSATLNLNNLFDKRYYTNINASGWYGEPRNAALSLRYSFR